MSDWLFSFYYIKFLSYSIVKAEDFNLTLTAFSTNMIYLMTENYEFLFDGSLENQPDICLLISCQNKGFFPLSYSNRISNNLNYGNLLATSPV